MGIKKVFAAAAAGMILFTAGCTNTGDNPSSKSSETVSKTGGVVSSEQLRGVFFNPNIEHSWINDYPFVAFQSYMGPYQTQVREALGELSEKGFNYIDLFLCNLHTMKNSKEGNKAGQPIQEWGNFAYLDSFIIFLNDCWKAGISVQVDLVDNRWMPYRWDSENHLAQPGGWWPVADDDPWDEAATWYSEVIKYVEANAAHPEVIAAWGMMGNYQLGSAEPTLWYEPGSVPYEYTEKFVKNVWPVFKAAGKRPKASPYMLPIFEKGGYWANKTPDQRLLGFHNLKKWMADDLKLPPDYWMMSSYTFCDPAEDGYHYFRRIKEILTEGNDGKIISTDLKCLPGHLNEVKSGIAYQPEKTMAECMEWHLQKADEYGFKGWWVWSYQDSKDHDTGVRTLDGVWKEDVLSVIGKYIDKK